MKPIAKVGVKFCGNCNPHIDMLSLYKKLKIKLPNTEFIQWDEGGFSILLILNSCPIGCATHPEFSGPKLIVTSDSINYMNTLPEDLCDNIIKYLNELNNSLVDHL